MRKVNKVLATLVDLTSLEVLLVDVALIVVVPGAVLGGPAVASKAVVGPHLWT